MRKISVLIPTYNRCDSLADVLPSYMQQMHVEEIIIVNDGSSDRTGEVLKEFAAISPIPVRVINNPSRVGQQACRHMAISAANTEWVLFGEDDVWLGDGYCGILLERAQELSAQIVAGRLVSFRVAGKFSSSKLADSRDVKCSEICDMKNFVGNFDAIPSGDSQVPFLHSIALIRRDIFARIGFDTWYKGGAQREETDFYLSANRLGYRVYFSPFATCFHLRGQNSATGGQRINRLVAEYYFLINTWHMVQKNWEYLTVKYGFKGCATCWTAGYFLRRQIAQFARVIKGDFVSSFRKRAEI